MALCMKTLYSWNRRLAGELDYRHVSLQVAVFHKFSACQALRVSAESEDNLLHREPVRSPAKLDKKIRAKSLREMPGPGIISNVIEFFFRDGFSRIHEIQLDHTQRYGKIFKSRIGPQLVVSIADRDMVEQILRLEGTTPQRGNMESWKEYRDLRGRSTGLISAEGSHWLRMRSVLRQLIMRPRAVAAFSHDVNAVVADLVCRIRVLRGQQSDALTVPNVNDLFFKYAMESAASILYECRLGCLEERIPQQSQEYIAALHLMFSSFKTTMYAGAIPRWLRPIFPKPWAEFCHSWDGLFKFSQIHVDQRLAEIQEQVAAGQEVKGGVLTHMLVTLEMNIEEIYANLTELLLAGVDTTSFTLSWSAYLLASHPQVQQQIYEEVAQVLGHDQVPVAEDITRLPLIRGLVKETLRYCWVCPQTQLALCHYTTSMDEESFPGAAEFRPERWVRKDASDRVDNFASIPFGYGIRSCVGRRIAELEMYLALTQLIQKFKIELSPLSQPVHARTHGLLCPGDPINL
ncbi:hypothetical protein JZ751_009206, partial [Albula glossodonta]